MNKTLLIKTLIVCLLPVATVLFFSTQSTEVGSLSHLINGIIMACECVFLLKWIIFAMIAHHLRGEHALKTQTAWLLLPLMVFAGYIVFYFL